MKRGCGCLLLLGLLAVVAVVLVAAALRGPQLAPVPTSHVQAVSAQAKLNSLAAAVARAKQTGRPVPFSQSFTDGELSSLVNENVAASGAPFDGVILHSNAGGYIEGQANTHFAGQTFPLYLKASVDVKDGQAGLHLLQSRLGFAPVPASLSEQINAALNQGLNLGAQAPVDSLKVVVGDGTLTLSGVARPT